MLSQKTIFKNKVVKDIFITALFGFISVLLGRIQIETPGFEGSYSDLREVALLISLFHIVNPLFIIPLCLISLLGSSTVELRLIAVFLMHVIPLFSCWYIYKYIQKMKLSAIILGLLWFLITVFYYTLLLYPILIVTYHWVGINTHLKFNESYQALFDSGTLEMISTALVTSFYLIQLNIRRSLEKANKNLEKIVEHRTHELTNANHELTALNENLEQIVRERTDKINTQLSQMIKYVNMNSHEVRAPLARILGLMQLIEKECDEKIRVDLLKKINESSIELDKVVKKMNRILEQEM